MSDRPLSISAACNTGRHYDCKRSSCRCTCHRFRSLPEQVTTALAEGLDFYGIGDEVFQGKLPCEECGTRPYVFLLRERLPCTDCVVQGAP